MIMVVVASGPYEQAHNHVLHLKEEAQEAEAVRPVPWLEVD